jgi:tripartite motif-containing protein 71
VIRGVAVDGSENVYVVDSGNNRIQKFTSQGIYLNQWGDWSGGRFDTPGDIAVDRSGNVYVVDFKNYRVVKFTPQGGYLGYLNLGSPGFFEPWNIAVDGSGNAYVLGRNYNNVIVLQKFNSEGEYLLQWGSSGSSVGQFNDPRGIAVDGKGNVYVTDSGNYRIQKFTAEGGVY